MRKLTDNTRHSDAVIQHTAAAELGIVVSPDNASSTIADLIEQRLGKDAMREQARWFVLSVMRHLSPEQWTEQAPAGISRDQQYTLAEQCLSQREFVQSLKIVLKDDSCKYGLIEFGRTRNTAKRILANTTVAFQVAEQALRSAELLTHSADESQAPALPKTSSLRRAQRRGFVPGHTDGNDDNPEAQSTAVTGLNESQLSAHEVEELEQLLSQPQRGANFPRRLQWVWRGFGSDESRSWLLGLSAGLAVFALFLLLGTQF